MSDVNTEVVSDENTNQEENNTENEENQQAQGASGSGKATSLKDAAAEVINSLEQKENDGASDEELEAAEEEAVEEAVKKWKLKVGGKEIEINDEEELLKRAQMGYSADEKWQEAAKIRKEMEAFVKALQQDPGSALQQMGFDVDALAEQHIQRRIEEMQKSPEQLEREQLQKEIENLRKEREKEREDARTAEIQRMQEQYAVKIENEISDALDGAQSLPKSPYVVKRIADALLLAMNNGYEDVKVADILPIVENDIKGEIKEMFSAMPEELVEAVIGKDVLNRLRKSRITKAKTAPAKPKVAPTGESEIKEAKEKANKEPKDKVSARDFFRSLGSY